MAEVGRIRGLRTGVGACALALALAGCVATTPVAAAPLDTSSVTIAMIPQRPETPDLGVFGQVEDTTTGTGVPNAVVQIRRMSSTGGVVVATTTADGSGNYQTDLPMAAAAQYVAQFAGTDTVAGSSSPSVTGGVTAQVVATPNKTNVKHKHAVLIDVQLVPAQPGTPVVLQWYVHKHWTKVAGATLNSGGDAHFWVKPADKGRYVYRVLWAGDAAAGGNNSGPISIRAT